MHSVSRCSQIEYSAASLLRNAQRGDAAMAFELSVPSLGMSIGWFIRARFGFCLLLLRPGGDKKGLGRTVLNSLESDADMIPSPAPARNSHSYPAISRRPLAAPDTPGISNCSARDPVQHSPFSPLLCALHAASSAPPTEHRLNQRHRPSLPSVHPNRDVKPLVSVLARY